MNQEEVYSQISAYARGEWSHKAQEKSDGLSEKAQAMIQLENACQSCDKCPLYQSATQPVFGEGSVDSGIMIIGEAPGKDEDIQGRPFVGRSGQLLRKTLQETGYNPADLFIGNILKHRPPNNRNPENSEIEACTPWLEQQIVIIEPRIVITLGNFSTKFILQTQTGITKMRGQVHDSPYGFKVFPTFHPSAILRNMNNMSFFKDDLTQAIRIALNGG